MTPLQSALTIVAVILGTVFTRFIPFILFPANKELPPIVKYIGNVLPNAVIGLLVVYSLKNISFIKGSRGIPEIISLFIITFVHLWKRNTLLSIASGTIIYMALVQYVFV